MKIPVFDVDEDGRLAVVLGTTAAIIGVLMSLFHLYFSSIGLISTIAVRSGHLMFASVLILLIYPVRKGHKSGLALKCVDLILAIMSIAAGIYIIMIYPNMSEHLGALTIWDQIFGVIIVVTTIEITRRTIGMSLVIIAVIFLLYAMLGPYIPGILGHRGFDFERIVSQMYCTLEGIYGIPIGVMATYVFLFVLFGAFLQQAGATDFFIKLSYAVTGAYAGGPAKAAVIASGFMGSVSGSAVANTVTTGTVTIPLMKKVGYRNEVAGGVEAAASTGGQLMPPLMGAGAFIMSEFTGIAYIDIIKVSIIPAVLYYLTVGLFVHNEAVRFGLKGIEKENLPQLKTVMKEGWLFLFPIGLLIVLLVMGYSPTIAATWSILTVVLISQLRKSTRMNVDKIIQALAEGSRMAVGVSAACAAAGIIVGVVGLTGLGLKISALFLSISGHNVLWALILVVLASLILGMGLPVTASYIMLAVLAGPALQELGMSMLAAHLIIFWYSQDANVTPPVCLAGYAAASIAGSNPMRTGLLAWKFSKGLYLIPLLFAFEPDILLGNGFWPAMLITLFGIAGLTAGISFLDGILLKQLSMPVRILMLPVAIGCFWPTRTVTVVSTVAFFLLALYSYFKGKTVAPQAIGFANKNSIGTNETGG